MRLEGKTLKQGDSCTYLGDGVKLSDREVQKVQGRAVSHSIQLRIVASTEGRCFVTLEESDELLDYAHNPI